jgi:hypothetical protein
MTGFNWDNAAAVISAKNAAVKSGSNGFTGKTARIKLNATDPAQIGATYTMTSTDIAIVDFGAGALSAAGYPAAPMMESGSSVSFNPLANAFIPVSYAVPGSTDLNLQARDSRKAVIQDYILGSDGVNRKGYSGVALNSTTKTYDIGCWGDSGAPAFYQGKVVGVASAIGLDPQLNSAFCAPNSGSTMKGLITFVGLPMSDISSLQTAAVKLNSSGTISLVDATGLPLNLWTVPLMFSDQINNPDVDARLPASERSKRFVASATNAFTLTGTTSTGVSVWSTLSGAKSQTISGTVKVATAANAGAITATWNLTGLTPGYYKVEALYPRKSDNAMCVLAQTKSTLQTVFVSRPARLNMQLGTGITAQTTTYSNTISNLTPYATSNAASYIWVDKATAKTTGSLSVRLSDSGCLGGKIPVDTIRVTLISTVK